MGKFRVSQVVGLVNVKDVQAGWQIRRRGAWCEVLRVEQLGAADLFLWTVYVTEYVKPLEFISGTDVMVIAPVEGAEGPPFLPQVPTVKFDDMEFPEGVRR